MKAARIRATETGGRQATTRHIPPRLALAVGMPSVPPPKGWRWTALTDIARLKSGHTPSRKHPEYWGGKIPWISIQDAKANDGKRIEKTHETVNELGIANSSARVLPANTVCLSRTASVGYVTVMGCPMATSQDFVNWVCSEKLNHSFLKYLFIAEGDNLLRFASGAVHQTIYFPEVKAFHICLPSIFEQERIVGILDEVLADIAAAKSNYERNLRNTRALFESHLQSLFVQCGKAWTEKTLEDVCNKITDGTHHSPQTQFSEFGPGRFPYITSKNIRNNYMDLSNVAYVEAAFHDEVYARCRPSLGDVLLTKDGANTGNVTLNTLDEPFSLLSSVCLIKTNPSVLEPAFLCYYLQSSTGLSSILGQMTGAAIKRIVLKDIKKASIPIPPLREQKSIVATLNSLRAETQRLTTIYERKLAALEALRKSLLQQAFSGELTKEVATSNVVTLPRTIASVTPIEMRAGILALAYQKHEGQSRERTFGHVKAEKIAHMVESHVGIDCGRNPVKDAAGPNDYRHLKQVEHRAEKAGYFSFKQNATDSYRFKKLRRFDQLAEKTRCALGDDIRAVDQIIDLMIPMQTQQAEIFATVYAAWNNLLLDGKPISDEAIVSEARENWHKDKLKIPRDKFFKAIEWMREKSIVPMGRGKRVVDRGST